MAPNSTSATTAASGSSTGADTVAATMVVVPSSSTNTTGDDARDEVVVKTLWEGEKKEHEACGVGFLVKLNGEASHELLRQAETMSQRMEHRGACSCDNLSGDGAGVLVSIPHDFYVQELKLHEAVELPPLGSYATGLLFLEPESASAAQSRFADCARKCGLRVLCWRSMPSDRSSLGQVATDSEPLIRQVFVAMSSQKEEKEEKDSVKELDCVARLDFSQRTFLLRKWSTHRLLSEGFRFYICSLSSAIVVYKGQFSPGQLWSYFTDLNDERFHVHVALVHARFSTNTFPSWDRAHPLRMVAHNGEINTLRGNVNWMRAREGNCSSPLFGADLSRLFPVVEPDMSDSGSVDNVLEFLLMAGGGGGDHLAEERSLPEVVMTMIPEAMDSVLMPPEKQAFYKWAACSMEPWDGPALLTFTDGRYVGAILDRNGLRPSRYYQTHDGLLVMASEVGVVDLDPKRIKHKGRLRPGRLLLVDTVKGVIIRDDELKLDIARKRPLQQWLEEGLDTIEKVRGRWSVSATCGGAAAAAASTTLHEEQEEDEEAHTARLELFGYTSETLDLLLVPMALNGKEALGSMGNDASLAILSKCQPLVYDYFKQLFAQVTNPPIDPFRERVVMSLGCPVGKEANLLVPSAQQCQRLWLDQPVLLPEDLEALRSPSSNYNVTVLESVFFCKKSAKPIRTSCSSDEVEEVTELERAIDALCDKAKEAVKLGSSILVISDKLAFEDKSRSVLPVPVLLAVGAVHHALIGSRQRQQCAIVVESAETREVHQHALLIGYGADAICPYFAFEAIRVRTRTSSGSGSSSKSRDQKQKSGHESNFIKAIETGLSKIMAKMGISTLQSYKAAQIFEAVGLSNRVIDKCFKSTPSRVGGACFDLLERDIRLRHLLAFPGADAVPSLVLRNPGIYHFRHGGEAHLNEPQAVALLQEAAQTNSTKAYADFSRYQRQAIRDTTLRGQLELCYPAETTSSWVPLCEVEPAKDIVRRFCTGAMSFGSISIEAHSALAIAMNRLGGKSNTGEGGEDEERFSTEARSAIKQVASGRFGVTAAYLANADELQIKMAQGAKPGEGGELPGHKVTEEIAKTRHSVPGVGLISPPPHHDIYSIEDLAQLIYDLKSSNPLARVSVKLVSCSGVGVVAAGVAKGKAEHITVSGHDGGTGASSWTGIKGAGLPWELGLSETHQVLVANDLRSRVVLQVDGQIRTAFDVLVAACLGADEFAMSTAPLIVLGCTMMRKCHLNTCPVGVATQDPELRRKFAGQPEHVINYLFLLAEEIRAEMARLGFRRMGDLIGKSGLLRFAPSSDRAATLDLDALLCDASRLGRQRSERPKVYGERGDSFVSDPFDLESRKDNELIEKCRRAFLLSRTSADDPVMLKSLQSKQKSFDTTGEGAQVGPKNVEVTMKITNRDRAFGTTLSYWVAKQFGEKGLPETGAQVSIRLTGHAGQSLGAFLSKGINITLEGDANDFVGKGLSGGTIVIFPPKDATFLSEENIIAGNVCLYGATSGTLLVRGVVAERFAVRNSGAEAVVEGVGDHGCEYMTGGLVLILGPTGRNFGAGMSGGLAFVLLDADSDAARSEFAKRCNRETFSLEALDPKEDTDHVVRLLQAFEAATGSEVARALLCREKEREFPAGRFVKVYPHEYRRVLEKRRQVDNEVDSSDGGTTDAATLEEGEGKDKKVLLQPLDKTRGFVKYRRISGLYRDAKERDSDWNEVYDLPKIRKEVRVQASRCMDCGIAFCQSAPHGCPLNNLIPVWNDLVSRADSDPDPDSVWLEATRQLLQTNNFPEFTGRVCPAPCEGACVLGINSDPVAIKSVELAIAEVAFEKGFMRALAPKVRSGQHVSVVGGGPAGLALAAQLNQAGHSVTVFDRQAEVGGLLMFGIPNMKLDKDIVRRRIALLEEEGVVFRPGTDVGRDVTAEQLLADSDAVCLAFGATWPRDLNIEGRQLDNILFAMDYLSAQAHETPQQQQKKTKGQQTRVSAQGKHVVVIGGGDTGCDCIATAHRQGAASVTAFEILPQPPKERDQSTNPWPQWPKVFRVEYGHQEVRMRNAGGKDPRMFAVSSLRFLPASFSSTNQDKEKKGQDLSKKVGGILTQRVNWTQAPGSGQWTMSPVPDSEQVVKADLVLLAMGFLGPENYLLSQFAPSGLSQDGRSSNVITVQEEAPPTTTNGHVAAAGVPSDAYRTGHSSGKVFACGDCRRGQSLVVWAISEGRQCARQVDTFLKRQQQQKRTLLTEEEEEGKVGGVDEPDTCVSTRSHASSSSVTSTLAGPGGLVGVATASLA